MASLEAAGKSSAPGRILGHLRRNRSPWPKPERSAGDFLQMIGRNSCWDAQGPAREAFIPIAAEINEHLRKFSDAVPSTVTWSVCMIGRRKDLSRPVVVFVSVSSKDRKKIRACVEESGLLEKYPGFTTMDSNRPPGFSSLVPLGSNEEEPGLSEEPKYRSSCHVAVHQMEPQARSIRLSVSGSLETDPSILATAGGILTCGDRSFLMTAAHVFEGDRPTLFESAEHQGSFEYDLDETDFAECDDESELADLTSRGSESPERKWPESGATSEMISQSSSASLMSQQSQMSIVTALRNEPGFDLNSNEAPPNLDTGTTPDSSSDMDYRHSNSTPNTSATSLNVYESIFTGEPYASALTGSNKALDYALIEHSVWSLTNSGERYHKFGKFSPSIRVAESPDSEFIIALTATCGLLRGRLSESPSFVQTPNTISQQEVWTVYLDGTLVAGDCGCWIVDPANTTVYGHIVAGSLGAGTCLIVPMKCVLQDLQIRFGGRWKIMPFSGNFDREEEEPDPQASQLQLAADEALWMATTPVLASLATKANSSEFEDGDLSILTRDWTDCHLCHVRFRGRTARRARCKHHLHDEHANENWVFTCPFVPCGSIFPNEGSMQEHMKNIHGAQ